MTWYYQPLLAAAALQQQASEDVTLTVDAATISVTGQAVALNIKLPVSPMLLSVTGQSITLIDGGADLPAIASSGMGYGIRIGIGL